MYIFYLHTVDIATECSGHASNCGIIQFDHVVR